MKRAKKHPLSNNEEWILISEEKVRSDKSSKMPQGFDYLEKKNEEGFVKLEYLDFYDYLPKEDLPQFFKEIKHFVSQNDITPFGFIRSRKDLNEKMNSLGHFYDGEAFANIVTVSLPRNGNLSKYCSMISVSLHNLSSTFLLVKYRGYITDDFNSMFGAACKREYSGYSMVCRRFNIPWFAVKRFYRVDYSGNAARQKVLYKMISRLKWDIIKEIRKTFFISVWRDRIFPPTFETYSTNIRPSDEYNNKSFWDSLSFDRAADYAPEYNAWVCWNYKHGKNEGRQIAAYCGGKNTENESQKEIIHHLISDFYGVYLTASTMELISKRDIAFCNKKISKAIRKGRTASILKVRVAVERKLYYCYRFLLEFSGKSIDYVETEAFQHRLYKEGSVSSRQLEGVSKGTLESKKLIDNILGLLNNAAEYRSSKFTVSLQWIMMVVTILSLLVALCSINNGAILNKIFILFESIKAVIS